MGWLREAERTTLNRLGIAFIVVGLLNAFAFLWIGQALGGYAMDPPKGHVFYLRNHSQWTEVSKTTYWYSYVHGATHKPGLFLSLLGLGCTIASGHVRVASKPRQLNETP
jgi:hypothetical protein